MRLTPLLVVTAALVLYPGLWANAQGDAAGVEMATDETAAFIKGKSRRATNATASSTVSFEFKEDGTMYGYFPRSSDRGTWRIDDGKLCMYWQRVLYDGCGKMVRAGDKVVHLYPDGVTVHVIFEK
jgi:hypothetical protein